MRPTSKLALAKESGSIETSASNGNALNVSIHRSRVIVVAATLEALEMHANSEKSSTNDYARTLFAHHGGYGWVKVLRIKKESLKIALMALTDAFRCSPCRNKKNRLVAGLSVCFCMHEKVSEDGRVERNS